MGALDLPHGRWRDVPLAGWTLVTGMLWLGRDDLRQVRRASSRWWWHLAEILCVCLAGWWVNPLCLAVRRLCPGGIWVGDGRALTMLTIPASGPWTISNFCARPVGSGRGRPLLEQVCAQADRHGATLRLVAHSDRLAAKVYVPTDFETVGRTRFAGRPVMERTAGAGRSAATIARQVVKVEVGNTRVR